MNVRAADDSSMHGDTDESHVNTSGKEDSDATTGSTKVPNMSSCGDLPHCAGAVTTLHTAASLVLGTVCSAVFVSCVLSGAADLLTCTT